MAHVSYWGIKDISLIYSDYIVNYVMIKIFLLSSALPALHCPHPTSVKDDLSG